MIEVGTDNLYKLGNNTKYTDLKGIFNFGML